MQERKHPLAKCEECDPDWYKGGFADAAGPEDANILVVGEAPGAVEARTGVPFTGPSGILLDRVLGHHSVDRSSIRFTNVAACHPPFKPGAGSVAPPREVISACRPRLEAELEGRETFVLLGNTAKEAVLKTAEGITSVRSGPPKTHDDYPGVRIIPTIHPAACLRQGDSFPSLVKDIGKINAAAITFEPPSFRVFDDERSALAVLRELDQAHDEFALDIETGVDKDDDFTHPSELLCIGISYARGKAIVLGERALGSESVRVSLRELLGRKKVICHNGKYDIQVLMRMGYLDSPYCLEFDTMLASYVRDERPGIHGLKYLLAEEFGWPAYDEELKKYVGKGDSYALVPRDILYRYNAFDAAGTYLLCDHLRSRMDDRERQLHRRLVSYAHELIYVELDGVAFDLEYNQQLYDHFEETLIPYERQLAEITGRPGYNPRSHVQTKEVLHDFGVRVPNTEKDTLQLVLERTDPRTDLGMFLVTLLAHKLDQKSYSTYVKGMRKRVAKDGRIYSTFGLHNTVTGRTSSRNPNLQNITRGVTLRKQFIPEPGNVFVQCDYGQIEGRVLAIEADDTDYLLPIFEDSSRDLFDELGTPLYGSVEAARLKQNRVRTKAYFYGLGYGREAFSIATEYRLPVKEVERDLATFFAQMPKVVQWQEETKKKARSSALETHFGRRRRFWLVTKDNARDVEKEGLAFVPQSTANDINLSALCRIRRSGLAVRIPVHDSIMVECAETDKLEVAHLMCSIMEQTAREEFSDRIPFPVDYEFGYDWGTLSKED